MGNLPLCLLGVLFLQFSCILGNNGKTGYIQASTPPRGWNSYDAFSWIVNQHEFLQNAAIVSNRLRQHGYKYVVVDFLWYRKNVPGASQSTPGFDVIDEWGRPIPDPTRWPSSKGGLGFKPIADIVHKIGLKFGIHTMRGISTQALNVDTPILGDKGLPYVEGGRNWTAKDIGLTKEACAWMPRCFVSVNTKLGAGRAFLKSLYTQYAEWGVDFVKNDCVFGKNLNVDEITTISEILREIDRPIVYSLSPGSDATPKMAMKIKSLVNMYRVTDDDWDKFNDLYLHFNVSRDFALSNLIGSKGLRGKSWPDLDMLPFGFLTDPGANYGPHRFSNLTLDEQKTQMTLWAMSKSPIMFGGDLRNIEDTTYDLITNPVLLSINAFSVNNSQVIEMYNPTSLEPTKNSFNIINTKGSKLEMKVSNCESTNITNQFFSKNGTNQICWKGHSSKSDASHVCMYRSIIFPSRKYRGEFNVLAASTKDMCLDSSPNHMFNFGEVQSYFFAPCAKRALTQMWELRGDGTLHNSYTGLCARISSFIGAGEVNELRVWKAFGPKGEVYIAFFNLTPNVLRLSPKEIGKAIGSIAKSKLGNVYHEVWSGRNHGTTRRARNVIIPSHGVALFEYKQLIYQS